MSADVYPRTGDQLDDQRRHHHTEGSGIELVLKNLQPATPAPESPSAASESADGPGGPVATAPGTPFASLDVPPEVSDGIRDAGFTHCTPIQDKVLPLALAGRDTAGQAQTGTGKTAAFLITLFTKLLANRQPLRPGSPRALVIAPTRELVVQIAQDAKVLGAHTGLVIHAVYGGVDYRKQRDKIEDGIDVLIGTPGRLIDYFKQRVYTLRRAEVLVIDEADRMFDMGFIRDLRFLLRRLPPPTQRQSMLFSATLSYAVLELAYEHMNDPTHVSASSAQITAENIEHCIYHVGREEKLSLLVGLLRHEAGDRVLVFTNMRRTAHQLVDDLEINGIDAAPITGEIEQRRRLNILSRFKSGDLPVLVATDVASRGLHIDGVTHVINYDLPQDAEDYVHRVGRTARAGATGKALSLVSEDDAEALDPIERLTGFKMPFVIPEEALVATVKRARRRPRGPRPYPTRDGGRRNRPVTRNERARAPEARGGPDRQSHAGGNGPGPRRRRKRRQPSRGPAAKAASPDGS
jgi:ATP-dependent RNA helicase RhlB